MRGTTRRVLGRVWAWGGAAAPPRAAFLLACALSCFLCSLFALSRNWSNLASRRRGNVRVGRNPFRIPKPCFSGTNDCLSVAYCSRDSSGFSDASLSGLSTLLCACRGGRVGLPTRYSTTLRGCFARLGLLITEGFTTLLAPGSRLFSDHPARSSANM